MAVWLRLPFVAARSCAGKASRLAVIAPADPVVAAHADWTGAQARAMDRRHIKRRVVVDETDS